MLGKMSVRKFWLAADPLHAADFTAETSQDAINPNGIVRLDKDHSVIEPSSIREGFARALRTIALCNIATCVVYLLRINS